MFGLSRAWQITTDVLKRHHQVISYPYVVHATDLTPSLYNTVIVCGDSIVSHCCHTEYWQALFEILYCQWESHNWPGLGVFSESLGLYLLISTEPSGSIEVASIILLHYWGKLISKFEAVMNRINTWIFHYQLHYKDIAQPFWSFLGLAESVSLWYIPKVIKSISH